MNKENKDGVYVHGKKVRNLTGNEKIFIENMLLVQENTNLKQALINIRNIVESNAIEVNTREYGNLTVTNCDDILQKIYEVLGDDK
jgi:hypothetical protein